MTLNLLPACAEESSKAGERLGGTAVADVDVWLLLEYRGKWDADIATMELPAATRSWLDAQAKAIPRSRVLFVRNEHRTEQLSFFVVTAAPERAVFRLRTTTYEELAVLDVAAIVTGGIESAVAQGFERGRPLYLVCTHGKRDACCAKRGVAFAQALGAEALDGDVWHSSHQGGHRFAATMLYLPHGVHYGRLELGDVAPLLAAHSRGHLHDFDRYRGLSTLSAVEQVAESWLREELDERRFDAFEKVGLTPPDAGPRKKQLSCDFRAEDGVIHRLTVEERRGAMTRRPSCGTEPSTFSYLEVVRHEAGRDLDAPCATT